MLCYLMKNAELSHSQDQYTSLIEQSAHLLQQHAVLFAASDTVVSYVCIQSEKALANLQLYAKNPACVQYTIIPLLFATIEHAQIYLQSLHYTLSSLELEILRTFSPRIILFITLSQMKIAIRITHIHTLQDIITRLQAPLHIIELLLMKLPAAEQKSMLDLPSIDPSYTSVTIHTYSNFPACSIDLLSHDITYIEAINKQALYDIFARYQYECRI